jgi:hypothetical protein
MDEKIDFLRGSEHLAVIESELDWLHELYPGHSQHGVVLAVEQMAERLRRQRPYYWIRSFCRRLTGVLAYEPWSRRRFLWVYRLNHYADRKAG